ncbi:MAG: TULIP family P47-like protein [Roseibium sp.]|uniref:TULIP family P47-like protein n=1 Tax=Roseibium sp. TaxID=1936156 RepID=UPI00262C5CA6|nr:TULIP family P47-like protein [Roseibium sp.]MCV0427016.1 TULIP family P47-like protein [Roseibium sp.]
MRHEKKFIRSQTFRNFTLPDVSKIQPQTIIPRHLLPKEITAPEADTQGWDAASAIRLSQVNQALKATGVSPASFSKEINASWYANGDFGTWTMTRGGSGSIVFLKAPITTASMTMATSKLDFNDGSVTFQVKLKYLPQPVDKETTDGTPNNLLTDANARSPEDPAVVVQHIDYGDSTPSLELKALFQSIIGIWLNENLEIFNYIFAVVALNQLSQSPQFDWLKPTYTSYAYYDGNPETPGEDEAYFGVLTMTNGNAPTGLANQLPASAIPDGQGGAFLVGSKLFMENMILPAAQAAFPDASASNFSIVNGNTAIELVEPLDLEKVKVGAIWYQPTATSMLIQIVGDEIQTRMDIHIPISPGIDAYVQTESWNRLELVDKPDGTQTIGWVESREPKKTHYYKKADWVVITEIIVSVIGIVAAIVGGAAVSGIVRVVVVIIIGIIAGLAAATPTIIAEAISKGAAEALPPLENMMVEFTKPIAWPDTTGFVLSSVQINGSLQFAGNFSIGSQS